ncbi:hypothetical protein [Marinilactibacillus kalidii]|uniref:hypothetical protein n=1 Tax=Marinilactibacillus kalidii TaxID=2820274 RepID=UPI001ABE521A|nr:hypothetical protein [Marinilactibacillus kalidii]
MKKLVVDLKKHTFTKRSLLWSIVSLVAILAVGIYFSKYNIGPFAGEKISGLQDNHIRLVSNESGMNQLTYDYYGEYELNYEGNGIELYLDYYNHGKKESNQLLTSVTTEGSQDFSGPLLWGLTPAKEDEDTEFEDVYAKMTLSSASSSSRNRFYLLPKTNTGIFSTFTPDNSNDSLIKDKPVILWSYMEDGSVYPTSADYFNGEKPKTDKIFAVLYFIPK